MNSFSGNCTGRDTGDVRDQLLIGWTLVPGRLQE